MEVAGLGRALEEVLGALGPAREQVAAVGVAGMAESGAPLRSGRPVGPIIAWHDGRGEETVASLEHRFGPSLARWTGRRLRTVSSVAKLGWLLDHGLAVPDRWLGVPELALWLLTGAEATEHSLAARTGAYDVTERRFLPDVIAHVLTCHSPTRHGRGKPAFVYRDTAEKERQLSGATGSVGGSGGLEGRLFPTVRPAGVTMGLVADRAAAAFGLPAGIPVTIAGHDHLAAAAGLGGRPDDLLNSVGTAETLLRRLDVAPDVERALELDLAVTVWPGGEAWSVMASAVRSGLVIETLCAHLGTDPVALDALPEGDGNQERTGVSRGTVSLGQGIDVPVGPAAEMWTATVQALARRTAASADRVAALAGPPGRLVVFGGGSRSRAWLRAKQHELALPVLACPVTESAARGAALAAGVAAGWWFTPGAGPTPPLEPSGSDGRADPE